jgi:hypothetical protein
VATKEEKASAAQAAEDTEERVQPAQKSVGDSTTATPPPGQEFNTADDAREATAARAARGELENDLPDGGDARTFAREASLSASTRAGNEGREIAVLKDDPDVDSAGNRKANSKQIRAFLKVTGYKESDIIASTESRRTFVTENGGKYLLSPKGSKVRVIAGPAYPNILKEAEEEDE